MLKKVVPLLLACTLAHAAPFTPKSDAEVVERLPAASDPALRTVESLRRQLAARPDDTALRLDIAQRYFDLAMAQGDPRYVGYATAALAPLEKSAAGQSRYWLLRGLLQQYSHDFDGALASLNKASALDPAAAEPVAWRAAIRMVQARYADAATECAQLATIATPAFAQGCTSYVQASTGRLDAAYAALLQAPAAGATPELRLWQATRLAEMAVRMERWDEAQKHYRIALDQRITDQFLLASYADFLLQRGRPAEVLNLLEGWERSDVLLLRLALAGRAVADPRAREWAQQLKARFQAAEQRGERLHEQEAARWALDLESDPQRALALARSNYVKQKEPRDAEILMRAALAAKEPAAAQPAVDWLRGNRYEDRSLEQLAAQLGGGK
jgi:Tfp pilus assembly protein PilF